MTINASKRITLAAGDTTVYTLPAADLNPTGYARHTTMDIVVKSGQLDYAFRHNPGVDPADDSADALAQFSIVPGDGVVRIEGADNLANFRYKTTGDTEVYIAFGS